MSTSTQTEDRQAPRSLHRRRGLRALLIGGASLLVLSLIVRLVLDPLAAHYTKQALDRVPEMEGTFSKVHVGVFPPSFEIRDLKIIELPKGRWDEPLIYAERATVGLVWRKLLRGQIVANAELDSPKIVAVRRHQEKAKKGGDIGTSLNQAAPIKLDRLAVVDGEFLIGEGQGKDAPKLWIHKVNLVAENLATRKALMDGDRASLHMTGKVQRSGILVADAKMDPWSKKPTFSSEAKLEKLDVRELYGFLANKTDMHADAGVINVYVKLEAKEGALRGGVKPVLENIELAPNGSEIGKRLKTFIADKAIKILSDDRPAGKAVATVIPISGTIDNPDTQLVPTVLGVVRNAFVVGFESGFAQLPPPVAEQKEGVVKQAWHALKRDDGPPPAQPNATDGAKDGVKDGSKVRQGRTSAKPSHPDPDAK